MREDTSNEARTINRLCRAGSHHNIKAVLQHGWLPISPFYFIDLPLELRKSRELHPRNGSVFYMTICSDSDSGVSDDRTETIWEIVRDIANALEFIHGDGEVHRDLKSCNGSIFCLCLSHPSTMLKK